MPGRTRTPSLTLDPNLAPTRGRALRLSSVCILGGEKKDGLWPSSRVPA